MSTAMQPDSDEFLEEEQDPFFYGWRMVERWREDGSLTHERVPLTEWDVLHPQEDDFIMTNGIHDRNIVRLRSGLEDTLAPRKDALILVDHRVDWQTADLIPHGPDISVFFNVTEWDFHRGTFPVREMNATPIAAFETTSPSTDNVDLDEKVVEYHLAGVPLYVIVHIRRKGDRRWANLMVHRWTPEGYTRVHPDSKDRYWLESLQMWLGTEGDMVVCYNAKGERIPDRQELNQQRDEALQRAEDEKKRAEDEKKRAEDEKKRADEAVRRASELEAELRRLRGES